MSMGEDGRVIKFSLAGLIFLSISITVLMVPAYSEEMYHLEATLRAPTPTYFGGYGASMEFKNDILFIGEWFADVSGHDSAGKAYIYDSNWNLTADLQDPTPMPYESFSEATVDIMDGTLAIASSFCNVDDIENAGLLYLYNVDGDYLLTLQSPDPEFQAFFGGRLKLTNDYIIAAEALRNTQGITDSGCVHVFNYDGDHITMLTSPSMRPVGAFGRALDADEEYIIIGEPGISFSSLKHGSVYVFDHEFNLVQTLQSPDLKNYTFYGFKVDISQDIVLVSEKWATVDGHERAGRVHVYDTEWELLFTLQSPTPEENGEFGEDVDIAGDLIVVGERKGDVEVMNEGKAYVYDLEGNLLATLVSPDPEIGAQFGYKVLTDGEIVFVDEVEASVDGESKAGKVHIFRLGEPATEQTEPEEEITEITSEPDSENRKGIPGFPLVSVVFSVALVVLYFWLSKKPR